MRTVLLLIFLKYSIIQCTPLPESRRLCKYKNVKIMNSNTETMTLDFVSTPEPLKIILKNECESWKKYQSRSKVRRSLSICIITPEDRKYVDNPFLAVKDGKFVVENFKQLPKDTRGLQVNSGKKLRKRSLYKVESHFENVESLSEPSLSQFEKAVVEELKPLFTLLRYTSDETQKVVQNDFGSVVAHFLRNGNFDGLPTMLSEKYDINVENIHQHKVSDYHRINHDTVNCDSKVPSISFNLEIDSIEENSDVLKVEMCEDLGFASKETNNYYYHEFPEATFSNSSGTYQIDLKSCAGDKILVCSSDAIRSSDCSVYKTRKCNLRTKNQNEDIYRKLRVGAVILGSFEHIIFWKNDLATVYKVTPHKLHYISPGASQRIEFGKHQLSEETDREQNIIIEIR